MIPHCHTASVRWWGGSHAMSPAPRPIPRMMSFWIPTSATMTMYPVGRPAHMLRRTPRLRTLSTAAAPAKAKFILVSNNEDFRCETACISLRKGAGARQRVGDGPKCETRFTPTD